MALPLTAPPSRLVGGSQACALPDTAAEWGRTLACGAATTVAVTVLLEVANRLGLLRLNFARLLGTLLLPDGRSARALGWTLHYLNGTGFAVFYRAAFALAGLRPAPPSGAALGAAHSLVALGVLAALGGAHPRRRQAGARPLSPTAYGPLTLPGMVTGHVIYGAVVAWLLSLARPGTTGAAAPNGGQNKAR